ncbi:13139_t:CDS:2, partial [Gigaspora rosea]
KLDQENLNADIKRTEQFLKTIDGGVTNMQFQVNTILSEVQTINEKMGINTYNVDKISPKELYDLPCKEAKSYTKKSIIKKLYRGNEV